MLHLGFDEVRLVELSRHAAPPVAADGAARVGVRFEISDTGPGISLDAQVN